MGKKKEVVEVREKKKVAQKLNFLGRVRTFLYNLFTKKEKEKK